MDDCDCIGGQWAPDDLLMRYQYVSDFFIALAYFSIPLELIYFVKKSAVFPYRWVLVQFGAFIVLCGATHLINMWTFREHSRTVALVMTFAKLLTALVSCATALMLVHIIPDLLSAKTRELFLKNKAAELDREMGLIRTQEETGRHVRMLTQEIRSSLDRLTILNTTLVELGKALRLEECALWMPVRTGGAGAGGGGFDSLQLMHVLSQGSPPALTVPLAHPTVKQVFSTSRAVVISPSSPVTDTGAGVKSPIGGLRYSSAVGDAVGVRVPLLYAGGAGAGGVPGAGAGGPVGAVGGGGAERDWQESRERHYALLVLMLPADSARRWHVHELEMVEVVADQVAVGLSHAAILEDSVRARDLLMQQNVALDHARAEAEKAIRARNDFLAVMNHEMRTPMHAIIALSTLLQETELTPEQRSMVDTVLKSSTLLATLIHDVLDLSHMDDASAMLSLRPFNTHALFREVASLVKPVASVKKLAVNLKIQNDVPEVAVGDERRLLQVALNVVGNSVKFTKEGAISIHVCLERPDFQRDRSNPKFNPVVQPGDKHFYVRVQVRDTGVGMKPEELRRIFTKFAQADATTTRSYGGTGLGLAITKRFVNKMGGHIWVESEGPGKGTSVTLVVRFSRPEKKEAEKALSKAPGMGMGAGAKAGAASAAAGAGGAAPADGNKAVDLAGLKVIVCDDNHVNRMVTKRMVSRLGCEVTVVGSGRECLAALTGGHGFKVLLQDLMMPDMDGYEVARRILERFKDKPDQRPKIAALTANTDQETKERCLALGMDGVITKPISLEKMQIVFSELMTLGKIVSDPKAT